MDIHKKIKKFIKATNSQRNEYLLRFLKNTYIFILPFLRIIKLPFVSSETRRNIFLDFVERITTYGPPIRYRYYFGFKLFYSCSKNGIGIVNHIMSDRIYEEETCLFLEESLRKVERPIFIDIGANIGLISIYMLNKYPDIKIYAFEPSPHQNELFQKTVDTNKISTSIVLSPLAISDKKGEVSFFAHNEANCSGDGFVDTGRGGAGDVIQVKTIPLDIWWKNNQQPKIDLIKIDTEGAELLVLKGAKEMLTQCSPDIFFEMQENNYKVYNYTWKDVLSFFESIGYAIYTESKIKLESENAEILMRNNYNFIAKKY
jgi:FkbM family methyltransferase